MKSKRKRIVRYRKPLNINIGVIIFAVVFIYIGICVFISFTREKVAIYEVAEGKSEHQVTFDTTGIALRHEVVTGAPVAGYINYYVKEGTRVSLDTTLYSIDESGSVMQLLNEAAQNNSILTEENLKDIRKDITYYISSYDNMDFEEIYEFQYDLNATLIECINLNSIDSINQSLASNGNQSFIINKAASTGIVEFYTDGLEGITIDTLTEDAFLKDKYTRKDVVAGTVVEQGAAIYKTINDESWDIVIPLTEQQLLQYSNVSVVTVELLDENIQTSGYFQIKQIGSNSYGVITLKRYMMNCASERFVNIRVIGEYTEGLKIPKTSVTEKDFYVIPEEYLHTGGNSNQKGFSRQILGTDDIEFITPDIFAIKDGTCYVDKTELGLNDVLVKLDSQSKYVVGAMNKLEGVYNVNTGYTTFRYIEILSEKNDYYIIKKGTSHGLSLYDQIILNASLVQDSTVVFH